MFEYLFAAPGKVDRHAFLRAATVTAAVCLLLLFVISEGGIATIAAKLGRPVAPASPAADIFVQILALAIVIFLPAPILLRRLRDIGLPPLLTFFTIGLVQGVISGMTPHPAGGINGPFAALVVLTVILLALAIAPDIDPAAEAVDAAAEVWHLDRLAEDWMAQAVDGDRRNDATFATDDRLLGDAALERVPDDAPVHSFPDYTKGEGFGRRRGDRR